MANKDYDLLEKLDGKGICAAVAKYDEDGKKLVGTKVTDAETRNGKLIITKSEGAPIEFSGEANVIEAITLNGQPQEPTDKTVNLQVKEVPEPDAPNKVLMSGEHGEYHWENSAEAPGNGELSIKVGSSNPVKFTANQSTNQEVNIPEAASATAQEDAHGGLITTADKTKLDEIDLGITPGTGADSDKVNIQLKNNVSANVLTAHQDVSGKAEKSEMAISPVSGDETKKKITLKQGLEQEVVVAHQDISGKAEKSEMSVTDVSGDATKKNIQLKQGLEQEVVVAHQDISGKAEKSEMSVTDVSGDATKKNIQLKDGLSQDVIVAHQDISGKAEKSEMSVTDVSGDNTKKNIQLKDGLSQDVVVAHQDISGKADKVTGATSGNFAGLDANGNLVDSGKKASDFASASAVQSVKMKDSSGSELNNGTNVIIPEASTSSPGVMSADDKSKLDGIEAGANAYTHPSHTAHNSGMYKVTIDAQGHVSSVAAIEKSDITALGIPAQDTTYQFADNYNGTTNKGATEATVRNAVSNAINALTTTEDSTGGTNIEIQIVEENGLIKEIKVVTDNTVNATDVNTAIETALANYGGFQVVPLTSGDNPQPDVTNPSEHYIYLTKDSQSSARDPYTEWIYTQNHWEVIGETSVDLSNYIQKVSGATEDNFAAFTADGAIKDSGKNASSFATAAQGTKAESAVQSVKMGSSSGTELKDGTNVVIPEATQNAPGVMSASDKSKLDGINNYIESATVSGRTMTLTPKSGPAVTFNDTGDINVIEKISVNGTQQTVTNKEVDLTIPAAANNAKITLKVGGAAAGDTTPEAGDFTVDQSQDKDIVIPAAVSASGNDPAKPGVMSSTDKTKLDGIANGAEVNSIESITIEGDQNPLPISSENVTIPKAAYTTGADPSYTTGAVTGQDKKKLDEIEAGAQVNDIEHIKIAGESADLTIDANKRVELPLAASATTSPVAPATPGIMSATDKDKLDHIAPNADVNVIEGVKLAGESSALTPDASKVVTIPEAAVDSSGATPVYSHGLMSAADKEKLDNIEQGAQVNVKPDWEAESGEPNEILNKPTIPTVNNSTISMKIEDDSTPFDSFSTNAASGKTIEIPLATAPAGASEGNSGAVTASDKYKLNNLTKTHIHMLKAVSDSGLPSGEEAPYGFWVLDMEKPNTDAPNNYGYDYATPADLIAGIRAGNIYGLYTDPTSPEIARYQDADLFIMGRVQNQESSAGALDGIRIWFYKLFVADNPLKMRVTTIYASHGRMALLPYDPATSTSAQNEYILSTRGVPSADSGDAGKFLGVDNNGDCTWQLVEHVPGVTSSDNGKVLTASYDSTTQTGSAGWASGTTRKVHRIYYDEDSAQTGDTFGVLQDLEGTFDTTNHCYPRVLADDFYDWLVEGQYIVLIIGSLGSLSSPPTPEDYYYGDFLHPNFIDYGIDQNDEKWVEIRFHQIDSSNPSIRWTFIDTTTEETPNYAYIRLAEDLTPYEQFPLQYDFTTPLTSGDAGKVLRARWNSENQGNGYVEWDDAREVPTVGSTDNGKVLKATYNSSTGKGSYAWDSASGEANVIEGVKLAGAASVLTPDAAKNVTIPNAVATGEAGATNGLMTAADKKTISESVIYKANPSSGAEHLLAQRLYIVRSDQEIINIITGGGAEGQGTILFRIG